ncbi:UNVERIFIED_CONTAM: hypothetical protein ABID98_004587 [Brevibacillus sp. OAP136]
MVNRAPSSWTNVLGISQDASPADVATVSHTCWIGACNVT